MQKFKTVSLADQVFEKLEEDIITGVYPRGELLTELKLVEQLGVSRTPIREAMRRLAQERLIQDSGKGAIVLGITTEDLMDIMNIRQRIEGLAAYYATVNITVDGLEELKRVSKLQDFYFANRDADSLRKTDDQFHDLIYDLSNRTVIRDMLYQLHHKTLRYRRASIEDPKRLEKSVQEHKAIADAICAGDAELASRLMVEHITNAKENMMERFGNNG